ncbi:MAG: flippase [candidate division KSB1 bacterium]|nr:flippase [candidate division KSB1 bacterium]
MGNLKRNTLFVSMGQVVRLVLAVVLYAYACRFLGDEDFGRYGLATTLMFFVLLLDDFGVNTWLVREVARARAEGRHLFSVASGMKVALIPLAALLVLGVDRLMGYDQRTMVAIVILAGYGVLSSFSAMCGSMFRAYEQMQYDALLNIVEKAVIFALGLLALHRGLGLYGLSWAFVAGGMVSVGLGLVILRRRFFVPTLRFDYKESLRIFSGAVVFGVSVFLTTLYNRVDMLMLSVMKPPEVWGWYAAAHRLLNFTNQVPLVFMIAMFPRMSHESLVSREELSRIFAKGFKYMLVLALPMIAGVIALADKIILFFSGPGFANAVPALKVLAVDAGLLFPNILLAGLLGASNHQNFLVAVQACGLFANAALNYALIPRYAHVGAAYATVATELLVLVVCLTFACRRIVTLRGFGYLPKAIVGTAVMVAVVLALRGFHLLVAAAGAALVYLALLFVTRAVAVEEVKGLGLFRRGSSPRPVADRTRQELA